jgi:hypothetical protein
METKTIHYLWFCGVYSLTDNYLTLYSTTLICIVSITAHNRTTKCRHFKGKDIEGQKHWIKYVHSSQTQWMVLILTKGIYDDGN